MAILQQVTSRGGRSTLGALAICLCVFGLIAAAQAPTPDVNTVRRIQTVEGVVEIEVRSNREFPIRDEVVVLRIGQQEFKRSRSPEDGSLKTLIFMLAPDEFDSLVDGAQMTVKYGVHKEGEDPEMPASPHRPRWNFGRLNKALHQR
jgi:hypothetical protein